VDEPLEKAGREQRSGFQRRLLVWSLRGHFVNSCELLAL